MNTSARFLAFAAALALCAAIPAAAEDRDAGAPVPAGSPFTAEPTPVIETGSFGSLSGEVATAWTEQQGPEEHQFVVLRNDLGQRFIVDLGPARGLAGLQFNAGDRIAVQGFTSHRGNDTLLMANRVTLNDRPHELDWYGEPWWADADATTAREYSGKVLELNTTGVGDTVVVLQTPEGVQIPVNIGPIAEIHGLSIRSGQTVQVLGRVVRVGDQVVLFADRIGDENRQFEVMHRDRDAATAPQAAARADETEPGSIEMEDLEVSSENR